MNKLIILFFLLAVNSVNAQLHSGSNRIADSVLSSYCTPNEPGMAIGIVQGGKVIYKKTIGLADLSNAIPITDSTIFNIASVSKQFTALLALMAEEEGMISLKDDITKYLPELENLPYKITVEQLANHTHGLPNYSDLAEMIGFGLAIPIENEEAVNILLRVKHVNFEPGSQYQYGNSGFMLLAEILKRVYQKPFPELIKEKIFEPLQMKQSNVIDNSNTIVYNRAVAYSKRNDTYIEHTNRQMESGSSNIHTSLNDMIKWAINFQHPEVGSQDEINRLMTETISLSKASDFVYGLGLFSENYKGLKTVFHGGGTAGYRAYILHVPDYDFSIITLGNQESFDGLLIIKDLLKVYLKEAVKEPKASGFSYSVKKLKEYAGTYKVNPGQFWTIETDEEDLFFSGVDDPLPQVAENRFKFFLPTSHLTFLPGLLDFRIADFLFHYEKVELNPPVLAKEELMKYIGVYKNEVFNTFYEFVLDEKSLIAKHLTNGEITLYPLSKNSFYANYPLGQLDFRVNEDGRVSGFVLSGQNFKGIEFVKLD